VPLPRTPDDPEMPGPAPPPARARLGFEPLLSPEDGLRRTIAYFADRLGLPIADPHP